MFSWLVTQRLYVCHVGCFSCMMPHSFCLCRILFKLQGEGQPDRCIMTPQLVPFLDEHGQLVDKEVVSIQCGGRFTCAMVARRWISDSETKVCMSVACKSTPEGMGGAMFTTFLRRHHCRNCGGVYCDKCTSHKMPILALGFITPVRVCDSCHLDLVNLAA